MDPLSISASIAGLVTLADVVIDRTYKTIITCKNAGPDAQRLLEETTALIGTLKALDNLGQNDSHHLESQLPSAQVTGCRDILLKVREKLDKANPNGQNTLVKIKRTLLWPITKAETDKILESMERYKATFSLCLSVDLLINSINSSSVQASVQEDVSSIRQSLSQLYRIAMSETKKKLLEAFGSFDAEHAHFTNLSIRQNGTGLWLLETSEFESWLNSRGSKLWCYGIPGAGKSVLAAFAIQECLRSASPSHALVYYYCDYKRAESQNLDRILACLAGQLARQHERCFQIIKESGLCRDTAHQFIIASSVQLSSLVAQLMHCFDEVGIVVDGLDECDDSSSITLALVELAAKIPSARMLFFSRDEPGIRRHLEGFAKQPIAARKADLQLFVATQLEERARRGTLRMQNTALKDEIMEKLVNGADGMFRWVSCQLDHLCTLKTDKARRKALVSLPPNLNDTYERILQRVNDQGPEAQLLLERTLQWSFAKFEGYDSRLLSAKELCIAIAVNEVDDDLDSEAIPELSDITSIASSLIRPSSDDYYLEPAHFTVEEFLRSIDTEKHPKLARYKISDERTRRYCISVAQTYCSFPKFALGYAFNSDRLGERYNDDSLYFTLAEIWPSLHISNGIVPKIWQRSHLANFYCWAQLCVLHLAKKGFGSRHAVEATVAIVSNCTALHFAAMFHLVDLIPALLKEGFCIRDVGALGSVVQCAILGTAAVNVAMGDLMYHSSGQMLTIKWSTTCCSILRILKSYDVNLRQPVTIPFFEDGNRSRTVQWLACLCGSIGEIVDAGILIDVLTIEQLKEDLAGFGAWIALKEIPPHYFEHQALQLLTNLLLQNAAAEEAAWSAKTKHEEENAKRWQQETLDAAVSHADIFVISWLTQGFGINAPNFRYENGDTLLHAAVRCGRYPAVKWLLGQNSDPNVKNADNLTPLHLWARTDRNINRYHMAAGEILDALLQSGADPCALDSKGDTFLHVCAREEQGLLGHSTMYPLDWKSKRHLKSVLKSAANTCDRRGFRPWACVLESLMATRHASEDFEESPRKIYDLEDALAILAEACDRPCTSEEKTLDPLHQICALADLAATKNILRQRQTYDKLTPLVNGVLTVHKQVDSENGEGLTCIDILLRELSVPKAATLACLIDMWPPEKPHREQSWAVPALCVAILDNNEDLGRKLVEGGVDVNAKCVGKYKLKIESCSPISIIYDSDSECSPDFISTCLARCEDPNRYDELGRAPIHFLVASDHKDRQEILAGFLGKVSVEVDLPLIGEPAQGATALMLAASKADYDLCRVLVGAGANVSLTTDGGTTALHLACQHTLLRVDLIQMLLSHGATASSKSQDGTTALHWACVSSTERPSIVAEAIKLLLQHTERISLLEIPAIAFYSQYGRSNDRIFEPSRYYTAVFGSKAFPHSPLELVARLHDSAIFAEVLKDTIVNPQRWEDVDWTVMPSALWIACAHGNLPLVKYLIAEGADIEYADPVEGLRCIHAAVVGQSFDAVRVLLERGCDVLSKDGSRRTALGLTTQLGNPAIAALLQNYQLYGGYRLSIFPQGFQQLNQSRSKLRNRVLDILIGAIQREDLGTVRSIRSTFDRESDDFKLPCKQCTPFLIALALGKEAIAEKLMPYTISLSDTICQFHTPRGYHAIHLAAAIPHLSRLYFKLLQCFPKDELDQLPIHPLHIAAAHGNNNLLHALRIQQQKMDIRIPYSIGGNAWTLINGTPCPALQSGTPLHVAIAAGHMTFAHILLDSFEPNANARNHSQQTPLHLAVRANNEPLVLHLLDKGVDVNACDISGPAIAHAAASGLVRMLDLLKGADLSLKNSSGFGLMTLACKYGHLDFVLSLLNRGLRFDRDFFNSSDYGLLVKNPKPGCAAFALNLRMPVGCDDLLWGWNDSGQRTLYRLIRSLTKQQLLTCLSFKNGSTKTTPLYFAAAQGNANIVALLVQSGADVDALGGPFGCSLVAACLYGRLEAVKMLVRLGASLLHDRANIARNIGRAASLHKEIIRWLLVDRYTDQKKLC
jgi:ankyrin repeat protein